MKQKKVTRKHEFISYLFLIFQFSSDDFYLVVAH